MPTKKKPLADPAPNTELRAALAGLVLQGMYANPSLSIGSPDGVFYVDAVREAVKAADLLIKELAK